jgi:CDP-glycerol glycerophosphotransferase
MSAMKSRVGAQYRRRVHPALRARIRRWRTPPPPRQEQSVTVLVTDCLGRPRQVRSCLDSVIRSSYRNIEILVITDQSSRTVATVVRSYARWDPRVKLVEQPAPLPSTSRSTSPNGHYVLVLQAPDRLQKNAVARLAKVLRLTESDFAVGQVAANLDQARSADTDLTPYDTDRLGLTLETCQAHPAADSMIGTLFRSDFLADIGWTVEAAGTIDQRDLMDRAYRSGRFDLVAQRVVWQPNSDSPRPHQSDVPPGATTITMTSADS